MPESTSTDDRPPMLVVTIGWSSQAGTYREETYGPWVMQSDDAHLEAVTAFMKAWRERVSPEPARVVISLIVNPEDPAEWATGA